MGPDLSAPGAGSQANSTPIRGGNRAWRRRLHRLRAPKVLVLSLGAALLFAGLAASVVAWETKVYSTSSLAPAGSFFALAASNSTLYAASNNGGSIVLQESTDRGVDWSANPVPYSAVAGGSPWAYSAVAVDGPDVLLTAATGGGNNQIVPGTYPPAVSPASLVAPLNGTPAICGTNSSILIANSPDGGRTWSTTTLADTGVSVSSLVGSVVGSTAAVAWMGTSTGCGNTTAVVGTVTSHDAGAEWSALTPLTTMPGGTPAGFGVEMAPSYEGLLVAYAVALANGSAAQLSLWQLPANATTGGFAPLTELPAPTSWSLQGSPTTPAYLLTPAYLIPLARLPYTALPFYQLQQDAPAVGELPTVVSLVATSPASLDIAATTSDDLGVDCWNFDVASGAVSQSCHVPLVTPPLASSGPLPIVALINGGGWWAGVGASGSEDLPCPGGPACYGGGAVYGPAAPSSVGTSVCFTGCSAANGLVAYSYTAGSDLPLRVLAAAATGLLIGGVVLLGLGASLALWSRLRARRTEAEIARSSF